MRIFAAAAMLLGLTGIAQAADIDIYAGQFSALRANQFKTGLIGAEYRFDDQFHGLRPTIGALTNFDGASYEYAGLYWDLPLGIEPIMISPGFAAGYYDRGGSKDLGYGLEFRSTMEVTYKFDDGQRFGGQISHISNASLGRSNPGVEMIQAVYSHPF